MPNQHAIAKVAIDTSQRVDLLLERFEAVGGGGGWGYVHVCGGEGGKEWGGGTGHMLSQLAVLANILNETSPALSHYTYPLTLVAANGHYRNGRWPGKCFFN